MFTDLDQKWTRSRLRYPNPELGWPKHRGDIVWPYLILQRILPDTAISHDLLGLQRKPFADKTETRTTAGRMLPGELATSQRHSGPPTLSTVQELRLQLSASLSTAARRLRCRIPHFFVWPSIKLLGRYISRMKYGRGETLNRTIIT